MSHLMQPIVLVLIALPGLSNGAAAAGAAPADVVFVVPGAALAPDATPPSPGPPQFLATHATRGVVKHIDATTLVLERFAQRGEITFVLNAATRRAGTIVVGNTISVRYRDEGKLHIATAIALQHTRG